MGPKKDIIGLWQEACRKHGLRFGVSAHLARSYSWFQTSHGADKKGSLAGVSYDGADPRYADFYHRGHNDTGFRYPVHPPDSWQQEWHDRVEDLVDSYEPDLLYFDGGIPFGEVGRRLVAHYYNANMKWHGGRLEAVLNIKKWESGHGDYRDGIAVRDMERGVLAGIEKDAWQNDTSIGPWYWREPPHYRSVDSIVDLLVDLVAKNGNLLLNVPLKPDGTLDPAAEQILVELGRWMDVCGEAIYGTRPWKAFGEGPTRIEAGHFKESSGPFTGRDIRFTAKDDSVYAICLAWPGGEVTIKSLAAKSELCPDDVAAVTLLGSASRLAWSRHEDGLTVKMPARKPCKHAVALRIKLRP
jgi:alpha-L-fucosidase